MRRSISAEPLVARKRASSWIVLGLWAAMVVVFGCILPYVTYRNGDGGLRAAPSPAELLPANLVGNVLGGIPFFGGVLVLILGVLPLGSDSGWGTLKTLVTQRPGRLTVIGAKLTALAIVLAGFVVVSFVVGALASIAVAMTEDAAIDWPSLGELAAGLGAAWLIFGVWAALGVALAVLSRGTALAIGIGILYGLVIEGLISALLDQVDALQPLVETTLRANGYSLIEPLGLALEEAANNGPGSFSGPYVGGLQALLVLAGWLALFVAIPAIQLRRRDVV